MLQLGDLYQNRWQLKPYSELLFTKPTFQTGLLNPFLFLVNKKKALEANNYTLSTIEDRAYDIHIVTEEQQVLFYLIDVKANHVKRVSNGLIIRNRLKSNSIDTEGVRVRYSMDHFQVITNKMESCSIFGTNITTDPKT